MLNAENQGKVNECVSPKLEAVNGHLNFWSLSFDGQLIVKVPMVSVLGQKIVEATMLGVYTLNSIFFCLNASVMKISRSLKVQIGSGSKSDSPFAFIKEIVDWKPEDREGTAVP